MNDTARVRWGVLGYARIARENLIPALVRADRCAFHALASRDEAKLADARSRFGAVKTYTSYDDLLRDPEVDAVYVPLPNAMHAAWTRRAAEHGKHVLCEKPLALDAGQCRTMVAACRAHGVLLMEALMYRYTSRTAAVLDVLRSGALGDVRFVQSGYRFRLTNPASIKLKPDLGGGALYDVGCYAVDFIGMVLAEAARVRTGRSDGLGPLPESVSAECAREGAIDVSFAGVLRYPGGVLASVDCGFNSEKRIRSEIVGTEGVLEVPDTYLDDAGALVLTTRDGRKEILVPASDRYRLEVEDFARAVLEGGAAAASVWRKAAESEQNAEVMDRLRAAAG